MEYNEIISKLDGYFEGKDLKRGEALKIVDTIKVLLMERNEAVEMLHGQCSACKNNVGWHNVWKCTTCKHETAGALVPKEQCDDNWLWCGVQNKDKCK